MAFARPLSAFDQRVSDVLSDGKPRTPSEIVGEMADGGGFIAQREISRDVMRTLSTLRERQLIQRLIYETEGVPVARYADAAMIRPVCMNCWRQYWKAEGDAPQVTGFPLEVCRVCMRRSHQGTYMPREEVLAVRKVVAGE